MTDISDMSLAVDQEEEGVEEYVTGVRWFGTTYPALIESSGSLVSSERGPGREGKLVPQPPRYVRAMDGLAGKHPDDEAPELIPRPFPFPTLPTQPWRPRR